MIALDLINNLALLAVLTVASGFIGDRSLKRPWDRALQGVLFGCVAVVGMLHPFSLGEGLIFDGRSVMISLCGLFFGPLAALIAAAITLAGRACLGGVGLTMGALVIAESAAFGLLFHYRWAGRGTQVSLRMLLLLGLLVHGAMVLLMLLLPYERVYAVVKLVGPSVMLIYPLATVLIGKVLCDQRERVRYTAELQSSREELKTMLYSIGDGIISTDAEGRIRQLNPVAERLLGWSEAEAQGKRCSDVLRLANEETREPVPCPIALALRDGRKVELAERSLLLARDGREFPITDSAAPMIDRGGAVSGAVLVFRDQTAERAAQRAVQVERDNLHAIMTASPVAILVMDESACVTDANPAAERMFGRKRSQLNDCSCGTFLGCANPRGEVACGQTAFCSSCVLRASLREVFATGGLISDRELEYAQAEADGDRRRWLLFSVAPVVLGGKRYALVALSDMTRHRQTEAALKRIEWMLSKKPARPESERRAPAESEGGPDQAPGRLIQASVSRQMLASIVSEFLDLLGTASAILEADGSCAYKQIESGWCRLMAASPLSDAQCGLPADWQACSGAAIAAQGPAEVDCQSGLKLYAVPILMRGCAIGTIGFAYGDPATDPARLRALADRLNVDFAALLREAQSYDTRPPYIIEMAKGRLQTAAWLIGSFAEARKAEAEHLELETQFRHSQKMEAVGRLAGGVAHDFNNILQGVIGYGELLAERLPERGEQQEFAREIVAGGKRAAALTRQLLAFSRQQAGDPRVLDLNEAVAASLAMLRRLMGEDVELCWGPAPQRCLVSVDPSQLEQLLANLAVNSRDAIDGVGRVTISTQAVDVQEAAAAGAPACKPGRYVQLTFSDTGCGMPPSVMEHLFEPFFTTKARGRGTGLGLATVYGIVEQSGGAISVSSAPGEGTTFKIYFPEQAPAGAVAEPHKPCSEQPEAKKVVLIVDDEESLLRTARYLLEGLGYAVLSADSPKEAIRLAQSHPGEIHVLLTDVVMPGMSGRDLWLQLESLRPHVKCIYMSGYTANIIAQRGAFSANARFLQKPFTKAALANKLREVLAS
jgi:PAS domain S-box-containing protein